MIRRTVNSFTTFGLIITLLGISGSNAYAYGIVYFNESFQSSVVFNLKFNDISSSLFTAPLSTSIKVANENSANIDYNNNNYIDNQYANSLGLLHDIDSSLELTDNQLSWLAEHPIISVCPDANYAPIEMIVEGDYTGLSRDYIDIIVKKTGLTLNIEQQGVWNSCYEKVIDKKIDVLPLARKTEDRAKKFNYSKPYLELKTAIITNNTQFINQELTLDDLYGKKVAVVKGYFWQELLQKEHPEIEMVEVNSIMDGLKSVSFGRADAMFASNAVVTNYIEENQITNLKISGSTPYDIKYRFGVRKDWEPFIEILDIVINSISEEEHQEIRNKWIKTNYHTPWYNKRLVVFFAIVIPFVLLIGGAFMLSLRRQVSKKTLQLNQKNMELAKVNATLEQKVAERTKDLEASNKKLKQQSEIDSVSQIANRHYLNIKLESIFDGTTQFNKTLTAFMIDVDYFKPYNDTYGHLKGDEVLYNLAQTLNSLQRSNKDVIARFGGEEFTIVCLDMEEGEAEQYAQEVLYAVIDLDIEHKGSKVANYLTVSIGFQQITSIKNSTPHQLLDQADEALYQAKLDGRNTFVKWCEKTISI